MIWLCLGSLYPALIIEQAEDDHMLGMQGGESPVFQNLALFMPRVTSYQAFQNILQGMSMSIKALDMVNNTMFY